MICNAENISDRYYPAECENCGWKGCSCDLEGGGPIADTGDHFDVTCPNCGSWNIEECDNEDKPNPGDPVAHEAYQEYLNQHQQF